MINQDFCFGGMWPGMYNMPEYEETSAEEYP